MSDVILKRIGIIRGGQEGDYDTSLREGGEIISHIFENLSDTYKVSDIFIDRDGVWHLNGIELDPATLSSKVDAVWNVSHPSISSIIRNLSIPQIDISSFSYLLKQNQEMLDKHLKDIGIKMPKKVVLPLYQPDFDGEVEEYVIRKAQEVHQKFSAPWIVRSFTLDYSMGIHIAKTFPELIDAILDGVLHQKSILIEEFIEGRNTSMHSVSGFRGQDIYLFPSEDSSKEEKIELEKLTTELHKHLGVEHYLKADFTIHPKRGVFVIGVSLNPDLKEGSHFMKMCESVGSKISNVVEHIIERVSK